MKRRLIFLSVFLSSAAFADNSLQLRQSFIPISTPVVNTVTPVNYVLINRSEKPINFQVTTQPKNFSIDNKYSNCGNSLGSHRSCQLQINFVSPKSPGFVKTLLSITSKNEPALVNQLNFQVLNKDQIIDTNPSYNWEEVTSLTGGLVVSVYQPSANSHLIYATTVYGDIYLSTDDGADWSLLTAYFNHLGAQELLNKNNALFCLTFCNGIYKSNDQGLTWQDFSDGLNINSDGVGYTVVNGLIDNNGVLYAAPTTGVFMRHPTESAWTSLNPPNNLLASTLLYANNILFAGNYTFNPKVSGIFALQEGDNQWTPLGLNGLIVQTLFNDNGTLYAGINNYSFTQEAIYKSYDFGKTWANVSHQVGYSRVMQFAKLDNNIYAATQVGNDDNFNPSGGGVYKSADNGMNWEKINNGVPYLNDENITALGKNLFLSTIGGLYKSQDGGNSWNSVNNGILERRVRNITVLDNGSVFVNTFSGDLFKSDDDGQTWNPQNTGLNVNDQSGTMSKSIIETKNGLLYLAQFGNVYKSDDNGASWSNINNNLNDWDGSNQIVGQIVSDDNGNLYLGGDTAVFVSKDGGNSWATFSEDDLPSVNRMVINHNELYVTSDGHIYKCPLDGKNDWQWINHNLPNPNPSGLHIYAMTRVMDNHLSKVFLATNAGVYFTQDAGESWVAANNGLPQDVVVTSMISTGSQLMIGTAKNGLFYSTDAGLHWQNRGYLPTSGMVNSLGASKNYIFAAGSRGLFKLDAHELRS